MIRKNKGWKEKALNLFKLMHNNSNQKAWKTSTVKREQEARAEMPLLARVIVCFNVDLQDKSQHPLSVGLLYTGQQNPFCWLKMHEQMIRATQWWCDHLLRYHHMPWEFLVAAQCIILLLGRGRRASAASELAGENLKSGRFSAVPLLCAPFVTVCPSRGGFSCARPCTVGASGGGVP